jgi:hypothetical protein
MPGRSSWMPYAPQGVKGFDDDEFERIPILRFYAAQNGKSVPTFRENLSVPSSGGLELAGPWRWDC